MNKISINYNCGLNHETFRLYRNLIFDGIDIENLPIVDYSTYGINFIRTCKESITVKLRHENTNLLLRFTGVTIINNEIPYTFDESTFVASLQPKIKQIRKPDMCFYCFSGNPEKNLIREIAVYSLKLIGENHVIFIETALEIRLEWVDPLLTRLFYLA